MRETLESLSKTTFEKQFREDYEKLNEEARNEVAAAIHELVTDYLTRPWQHPNVKHIPSQDRIWRLKVGNQGEDVDHRVFFDIDDEGLIFLSVQHRDNAYSDGGEA